MKRTLSGALLLLLCGLVSGQTNLPPCNANASPPVTANCTDYFGVANYANSPLPAGAIVGLTITAGGTGYSAPAVVISDPAGTGATATAVADANGVITGLIVANGGAGYIAPVITITDPTGMDATASATLGGAFIGGIRKFVDPLPSLPIAVADRVTFPGSDFYVIELQQYQQKMHTDLPATTLRGYVQTNSGTDTSGANTIKPSQISYLGPLIIAQRNRPVRILFKNMLPIGGGGNLFIPVDTTYMGAGMDPNGILYSQNRANLHLHGGATPWISDGTPHQWTAPAGESGTTKGVSTQNVPDMWFDPTSHALVAAGTAGATTDPGPGAMTLYWTNQQGGRIMFYHDHSYGITRLNVYAGEAAGYLLNDLVEETALANATLPGTMTATPDLAHLIPMVIQDKTFVPSSAQLAVEDPTWLTGNFGTIPGTANPGDLWFPHVYTPNQNPLDPDGVNAFGRWDYGPWFFPPQASLTASATITVPCTSAAFPAVGTGPAPTLGCPITPNPSGTPEGFMDTPLVNGIAYPVLHVAPAAYRFKILSAGNDRSWNLQLYVADPTGKDVAMMPAVPPGSGTTLPLCSTPTPITQPVLGIGLATATLDGVGNPINGTGLPANCWPTSWATDGRDGGVPDPRTAGPPFIQIGTEGGLLPAPVVIPSTPVDYEYNRRSVTVLSVGSHGLWLGPAERADVVVDFGNYAGKTLILYNDAPAPAPAFDSRYDYYTGDLDQAPMGGAPSTQPGYGPNTRTIMQIVVDGTAPNAQAFNLGALRAAFATTATSQSVFTQTQPPIIIPEAAYNSALNGKFNNTYSAIQDNQITFTALGGTTAQTMTLGRKAIQELFTPDYGRMNATMGTELPFTSFLTQTTIPLGFVDPTTETIKDGETQIWKVTHNGVDTHFIHFHLFNVQVINRMGWDGTIRPPDANELGWKDTVRMNPLEDIVVALKPVSPVLPWPVPDSIRPMDVTAALGTSTQFTAIDPLTNNVTSVVNALANYGWEYVWHCHILGHEESDMMRPITFQVAPPAPSNLSAALDLTVSGQVNLAWQDNSASESNFTVQRATDAAFTQSLTVLTAPSSSPNTAFGGAVQLIDNPGTGTFYYRAQAVDDNFKAPLEQTWNTTPALLSGWSNVAVLGATPTATAQPSPLAFGSQPVNTSASQTVTLTNTGTVAVAVFGVSISGANAADFALINNCPGILTPASLTCTITVSFKPAAAGARSALLTINSSVPTPLTVPLTGTGVAPAATATPSALAFGNLLVGSSSAPQSVTLSNSGSAPLIVSSIATKNANAADFKATTTCPVGGTGLAAAATCTINVTFTPAAMGARSSVLVITTSDPVTPILNVSLTGTGTEAIASVSPAALSFPLQLINTASATQTVTLSNNGNLAMTINAIGLTGAGASDYVLNYNCPIGSIAPLGAASSCSISLSFRPTTSGVRPAALSINSNALVNPSLSVALTGTGTSVNLSSSALTFGAQLVGTTSAAQVVTIANAGTTALGISNIAMTGANSTDFTFTSSCGTNLAAGRSCSVNVRFRPTLAAVRSATLQFSTSDLGIPTANVTISGTGIASAASLSPTSINFGTATLGQTAGPSPVTLTNAGTAPLIISNIRLTGPSNGQFAQTNTCPMGAPGLAASASCIISVTFTPTNATTLSKTETLQVNVAAPATAQSVALSGSVNVPIFALSPTALSFGTQTRRTTSAPQTITVSNTGTAPLTLTGVSLGGPNGGQFGMTSTCGASLQPAGTCTVQVNFTPTSVGAKSAVVNIRVAGPATSQSATLSGTGQ